MTRKVLNLGDVGDSTHWGTDDADYINKYLTGSDQSATDPVTIATTTAFNSTKLIAQNIVNAGNTITLPTTADTLVGRATTDTLTNKTISGASNTISNIPDSALSNNVDLLNGASTVTGVDTYLDGTLQLRNPANTFSVTLGAGAQTAARTFTFPVASSDTVATIAATQTLTNKTFDFLSNSPINAPVFPSLGRKIGWWDCGNVNSAVGILNAGFSAFSSGSATVVGTTSTGSGGYLYEATTAATSTSDASVFTGFYFYPQNNVRIKSRIRNNTGVATNVRVFAGLTTSANGTAFQNGLANTESGIVLGMNETLANWTVMNNDGTAAQVQTSTGVAKDNGTWHTIEFKTTNGGTSWTWQLDGGTVNTISTRLPATTTALRFYMMAVATETTSVAKGDIAFAEAEVNL